MRAALLALALLACGGPVPAADAGTDAPSPGRLRVWIAGPEFVFAGERACFVAHASEAVESVEWTWGDAEPGASTLEACRFWPLVGPRVIGVEVRARGMRASATHELRVVPHRSDPAPTSSSPILARGDRVWVVNPDSNSVSVLATNPPLLLAEIPVGDRPRTLAALGSVIAVACEGDGTVHLVDENTRDSTRIELGPATEPYGVIADPRGGGFVVSLRGTGEIALLDALRPAVSARMVVGPEPRGLAMNGEGHILATRWRSSAEGAYVYTLSAATPTAIGAAQVTRLPPDVGVDSDTDNDGVLSFLNQIVLAPDGHRAVIPALKANLVAGLFRTGEPLTSQTTARAVLGEVLLDEVGPAAESFRHSFDDLDYASAAVFSPFGDRLYVAMQGAQTIVVVDAFDFYTIASIHEVGEAPQGLALSPDGTRLYVQAFLSRSVREYDVSDLSREPPLVGEAVTVGSEPLSELVLEGKRIFYRSRDPRMSRTSYLSCASCHLDGEGDSLVWDFTQRGEGLRNTIELRGRAGLAHGPLHWSANFDEVQDFEHDIRYGQGGTGFLADALFHADGRDAPLGTSKAGLSPELDALAAYVASLEDLGSSPPVASPAARELGEFLFQDATVGCSSCHSGPQRTDSALVDGVPVLHDVGTITPASGQRLGAPLSGLDTPTLRGLWRSAPYLHDGSAPRLYDVLVTRNAEDRHGRTSHLTPAEIEALVTFLGTLE